MHDVGFTEKILFNGTFSLVLLREMVRLLTLVWILNLFVQSIQSINLHELKELRVKLHQGLQKQLDFEAQLLKNNQPQKKTDTFSNNNNHYSETKNPSNHTSPSDNDIDRRSGRQIESARPGALMYLPIGPGQSIRCPTSADSAAVSIAQMTFLATSMNIFSVVANISNNINNNNNNNNQVSYNAQSNNNVVTNTNVNNGNQVNVMVPILMP